MPQLEHIPLEVLIDNLLPALPLSSIAALGATSKFFLAVSNDDTFWKRKLESEFNFSDKETARTSGWKVIYKGLANPEVFCWGASGEGRLGIGPTAQSATRYIGAAPLKPRLSVPDGAGIVSLVAGGWSFHAIDSRGRVYVWGQLDGEGFALGGDGFGDPNKAALVPHRLQLPEKIQQISCGRKFTLMLDAKAQIIVFTSWGHPVRLVSPHLGQPNGSRVVAVEAGWGFGSALMDDGQAYAWFHGEGDLRRLIQEELTLAETDGRASDDLVVPCAVSAISYDPMPLPALPELPGLTNLDGPLKVVKLAAGDGFMVALTNSGHVLKLNMQPFKDRAAGVNNLVSVHNLPQWEYLPLFSEIHHVRSHPAFQSNPPTELSITHVSAHFETFFAYSTGKSSVVLQGNRDTSPSSQAIVLPELQQRNVISVVLGDYHFGALTEKGELLTWGHFSSGALGLGNPLEIEPGQPGGYATAALRARAQSRRLPVPDVEHPTPVHFGGGKKVCFAATAGGWHTGALVFDTQPGNEQGASAPGVADESAHHPVPVGGAGADEHQMPGAFPYETPPFNPEGPNRHGGLGGLRGRLPYFRIGYAGRGAVRGRGGPGLFMPQVEPPDSGQDS